MLARRIAVAGLGLILMALVVGLLGLGLTSLFGGAALAQQAAQDAGGRGMMGGSGMMSPGQTPGPGMMPGGMMNSERTPGPANTPGGMMDGDEDCGDMMNGGMMSGTSYNDASRPYDLRFLDAMIPHHQMAVQSAQRMISDSARPEMRDLAQRIIAGQQGELAQMQQWRSAWYTDTARSAAVPGMMGGGMMGGGMMGGGMMGGGMMGGGNIDQDRMFLQMMIPHHEAAIRMAQDALQQAEHPEVRTLAQQIITVQQAEIAQMQGWYQQWYGTPTP
jgi:uncharacterized protein (DUF305 family)